ncbi:cytosine deaminase [Salmonella enterica subsp. arizonae]|uniref:Cytosine deaminase n=1 Tax=Salmonella enterica subsp. arizonae TaxID=59203 RepID=A0A379T5Q4_SALER|nr:cytosine deaminase [Salmonella enterica subsp. arizonae]
MQNNSLTIRQARLQGREGLWQLTIENGRFRRIEPQENSPVSARRSAGCRKWAAHPAVC